MLLTREVRTVDYHTGGEPFRIVVEGGPQVPGDTVADRRTRAMGDSEIDGLRQWLCHEPRGHADMYGCFQVPPDDDEAHLGVLFWHKDGFSTACGHGTIALGAWAVRSGLVDADPDGSTDVVIDVPSGRVTARVSCRAGEVDHVTFVNVASYVLGRGVPVATSRGEVAADLVFGGAIYACVSAASVGLSVTPNDYAGLLAVGREVKWALNEHELARHPTDPRLSGVYGTILFDDLGRSADGPHQRNLTVFADGEGDRSPCGSGTSARVALLAADGTLGPGEVLTHESIVGTRFLARVAADTIVAGRDAVITEVRGNAFPTGEHRFLLHPEDPLTTGFVLR